MKNHHLLFLFLLLGSVQLLAEASPVWIASLHPRATAATDDGRSGPPDLGGRERPTFLRVDLAAGQVTLLAPVSRRGETSPIDSARRGAGGWILTGSEHERSWSIFIADTGHLTLSAITDGEVWSVFGDTLRVEDILPPPETP